MNELAQPRWASVAILFLGLTAAAFATATAGDLNVQTTAYPTIQAAVNVANTNNIIYIAPGVFTGQAFITDRH